MAGEAKPRLQDSTKQWRAALLTGRNHTRVGSGTIAERAVAFEGYTGVIPKSAATVDGPEGTEELLPQKRALSKRWAELVYRIYEVDPLTCPRCGEKMKLLAFIIDPAVIRRFLNHLELKAPPRAPPEPSALTVH